MNECEFHMDNCHENATCNDTIGSFNCTCNTGFEGDGVNCDSESDFVLRKVNEEKKSLAYTYITWNTVLVYIDISCLSLYHGTDQRW